MRQPFNRLDQNRQPARRSLRVIRRNKTCVDWAISMALVGGFQLKTALIFSRDADLKADDAVIIVPICTLCSIVAPEINAVT